MKQLAAKDIMTEEVLSVRADWSLDRLTEFLAENSISGAPVTSEGGELIGVVSLTDIVLHSTLPEEDHPSQELHDYYFRSLERRYAREEIRSFQIGSEPLITVRDIMTPMIFKVTEDTPLREVAHIMISNRIHRLFVTREEKVVGIIATPDMLKVIRDG